MPTPDPDFHAVHPGDGLEPSTEGGAPGLRVRLTTFGDVPEAVHVRSEPDHEERLDALKAVQRRADSVQWEGWLPLAPHHPVTRYAFVCRLAGAQRWLSQAGLHAYPPPIDVHFRHVDGYQAPRWVWDQVVYQVFPDRFRNGDPAIDPHDGAWALDGRPIVRRAWHERPTRGMGAREFFGGDLDGVREGLDHVADLGASTLYLNPIFVARTSHRYDTVDHARVDPNLGGDAAFGRLLNELRRRGMRIVLDAVVNHTSDHHAWFDRDRRAATPGAFSGPSSPHHGRYVFRDPAEPESYVGWAGVRSLPVLDFAHPGVRDDVYQGDEAILRRWLRPPWRIDGWRLDVIHMLGEGAGAHRNAEHVRAIRRAIREERDDAYVLGEHFFDAVPWLQGDQEDGAMNYAGFLRPILAFWAGVDLRGDPERCDGADLERRLTRTRARVPWPIALSQLNLLSSHDVPRFLTRLRDGRTAWLGERIGEPLGDRLGAPAPHARDAFVAAHHQLFGYVGVPCVYYGDEVGLEGGRDPDNRRPFPWDRRRWVRRIHRPLRRLAQLRRRHPALARGRYLPLTAEGDAHAFARVHGGEAVVVAVHRRGGRLRLPVGRTGVVGRWWDALDGSMLEDDGEVLTLDLPPCGGRTLISDPTRLAGLPPID